MKKDDKRVITMPAKDLALMLQFAIQGSERIEALAEDIGIIRDIIDENNPDLSE